MTTVESTVPSASTRFPPRFCGNHRAMRAAVSLAWREIVRFVRQPNRVVGAVGQPILFWALFGVGMHRTFRVGDMPFDVYFIPGTLMLILLFTSIFATISIVEDRKEGFLQSVLVAPLPRWSLVLGKTIGSTVLAVGQSLIFMALCLAFTVHVPLPKIVLAVVLMVLTSIGFTGLGIILAWRLDSTQGFHAIMNLLLMPMWLLSGAFFPVPSVTADARWGERVMHVLMRLNPVTYAVGGLHRLFFPGLHAQPNAAIWAPSMGLCWLITALFALFTLTLAAWIARRPAPGDLL